MSVASDWEAEIREGKRFSFGENWAAFLKRLDDDRIVLAEESLKDMLGADRLDGKRFADVGSGSGLFSLAARRLDAKVTSFDFDSQSVACTAELRRRYFPDDPNWYVAQGSVLDKKFVNSLGKFDIVYSWGVLHHTGAMWDALENVASMMANGGTLYLAIYNDQGRKSRVWRYIKRAYVRAAAPLKWLILLPAFARLWGPATVRDFLRGQPFQSWQTYKYKVSRGMDPWRDVVDWVGGYPFEVAKPEEVFDYLRLRGFALRRMKTCGGGIGCNEFVFVGR